MKKLVLMLSMLVFSIALVGCVTDDVTTTVADTETTTTTTEAEVTVDPNYVQGITDTTITVGNTAVASGAYAVVGVPFNAGMQAYFDEVNAAGGIDGRTINFITYDDGFDGTAGQTFTETLVETDKVFALVGHFGTPTVGATVDYIGQQGIPMVYAATGINQLYFEETVGNPVMAVQPIYRTDGKIMAARAVKESLYGAAADEAFPTNGKIGVLYTDDDAGQSMKVGIEEELTALGISASNVSYYSVDDTTVAAQVTLLQATMVDTIILAMNQGPFAYTLAALAAAGVEVPVFTSYVNAQVTSVDPTTNSAARRIYANAWLDIFSTEGYAEYLLFAACMTTAGYGAEDTVDYTGNAFAIAGYVAAHVFVQGLQRVADNEEDLTWASYIAAMEETPVNIPMGGLVDYTDGNRAGVEQMSLLQYYLGDNPATPEVETDYAAFVKVREIEALDDIEAKGSN